MKRIRNIHPGEVLKEEFLEPMEITAYKLAKDIHIPQTRVAAILKGERRITADTALRLSIYFGTSPKFWLGLQDDYDVEEEQKQKQKELSHIKKYTTAASTASKPLPRSRQLTD
jgi:addiction module HigA family antidote